MIFMLLFNCSREIAFVLQKPELLQHIITKTIKFPNEKTIVHVHPTSTLNFGFTMKVAKSPSYVNNTTVKYFVCKILSRNLQSLL